MASAFVTLSERSGVDLETLKARYLPTIIFETRVAYERKIADQLDTDIERAQRAINGTEPLPSDLVVYGPSLLEYISRGGGINEDGGELASRDDLRTWHEGRVGWNKLILPPVQRSVFRDGDAYGNTMDRWVRNLIEAGYLLPGSDISNLLEAIDRERSGVGGASCFADEYVTFWQAVARLYARRIETEQSQFGTVQHDT